MKRVAFQTLGCKLNYAETAYLQRQFMDKGYECVSDFSLADTIILNTCSVTSQADNKCDRWVNFFHKRSPSARIVLTGCYAQLQRSRLSQNKKIYKVFGHAEKDRICRLLEEGDLGDISSPTADIFAPAYGVFTRTRAFLKVQDGCDFGCSFCTIPLARGGSRSADISVLVSQARSLVSKGAKEIVLTGVNVGDYGIVDGKRAYCLADLVRALEKGVKGSVRFRISSIEPNLLSDALLSLLFLYRRRWVPHFHLPLQSGSDKILKRMRRRYLRHHYEDRVRAIRKHFDDACVGVDVIAGFMGEGVDDFMDTYRFLADLPVQYLHVFPYSVRCSTPILESEAEVIPFEERKQRAARLRALSFRKRRLFYLERVGEVREVLFEKDTKSGLRWGWTDNYIRVGMPCEEVAENSIRRVRLSSLCEDREGMLGEWV